MNRNRSGRAPVAPGGELALLAAADGSYALVREQASTADLHLAIFAQAPGLEVGRPGSCGPATAASPVSALALPTRVRIKSQPPLLARIKTAGVVPAPFYTYAHYHGNKWVDYGEEKMESMFAHRSFLDAGIPVAPASDYKPGPYEPMMAIQSMVTRKDTRGRVWGPSQRISVTEAIRICTMHGAYASFEENIKGSLEAGKLADFVILEKDPHEVDPDAIKEIRIVETVMGGRTTYAA